MAESRLACEDNRRAARFENGAESGDVRGVAECDSFECDAKDFDVFLKLWCAVTPQQDMRWARVLGHDGPLDAHELKSATAHGSLSEACRLLETVVARLVNRARHIRQVARVVSTQRAAL